MSNILKLSEATSIALHSMMYMVQSNKWVQTKELAEQMGFSAAHVSKVLQRLNHAGLVTSTRGPKGGSKPSRAAEDITLLEIYEAIEGPLHSTQCLLSKPICDGHCCLLGGLLQDLDERVRAHLAETTLAKACK
jgi:Rrf2 family protein